MNHRLVWSFLLTKFKKLQITQVSNLTLNPTFSSVIPSYWNTFSTYYSSFTSPNFAVSNNKQQRKITTTITTKTKTTHLLPRRHHLAHALPLGRRGRRILARLQISDYRLIHYRIRPFLDTVIQSVQYRLPYPNRCTLDTWHPDQHNSDDNNPINIDYRNPINTDYRDPTNTGYRTPIKIPYPSALSLARVDDCSRRLLLLLGRLRRLGGSGRHWKRGRLRSTVTFLSIYLPYIYSVNSTSTVLPPSQSIIHRTPPSQSIINNSTVPSSSSSSSSSLPFQMSRRSLFGSASLFTLRRCDLRRVSPSSWDLLLLFWFDLLLFFLKLIYFSSLVQPCTKLCPLKRMPPYDQS